MGLAGNSIIVYMVLIFSLLFCTFKLTENNFGDQQYIYINGTDDDVLYLIEVRPFFKTIALVIDLIFQFFISELLKATKTTHALLLLLATGIYILILNVVGILPYSNTVTAQLIGVLTIAGINFFTIILTALVLRKEKIVALVSPEGLSFCLLVFLVFIETISFFSRLFSLSLRLFANMTAGHALMKILIGFAWSLCSFSGFFIFFAFGPFLVVLAVQLLEFVIAFLQAYVFITLLLIYFGEVYSDTQH